MIHPGGEVAWLPPGSTVVCYADDTIVLSGGQSWGKATAKANITLECAVRSIRALGLEVAAQKTEAVFFHDGSHGPPPPTFIRIGEARVQVRESMRYLGLHLDSTWSFGEHFRRLGDLLRRLQRWVAIRVVRSNRTVSHAAATVLAGMPPLDLAAQMYESMYKKVRELRNRGVVVTGKHHRIAKDQARRSMILKLTRVLEDPTFREKGPSSPLDPVYRNG